LGTGTPTEMTNSIAGGSMTPDQKRHTTTETVTESHKPRMLVGIHVQFSVPQRLDVLAEL
jgi:hypothetical protein